MEILVRANGHASVRRVEIKEDPSSDLRYGVAIFQILGTGVHFLGTDELYIHFLGTRVREFQILGTGVHFLGTELRYFRC